jgi:hypothetical protein
LSYKVKVRKNRYAIVEEGSDLQVAAFNTRDQARRICRGLNLGCGFNGHTPEFFVQEFKSIKKATTSEW